MVNRPAIFTMGDLPFLSDEYGSGEQNLFEAPLPAFLGPVGRTNHSIMMEHSRKRKESLVEISSGMDSMDSDADDDDDRLSRISFDESRKFARANHSEIEKRRRDKMNSYITELSMMIPMCNAMNRKLDKLTVLRMAVQHMKTLRGSGDARTEVSQKPAFLSDDELKHLILKAADGFLFVVGCDRGRILYVSESVKNMLNYSQPELIGQSLFDILHPKDISKVKEQLLSSDLAPREKLIDAKTMLPVKTEMPQQQTQLCSGARRAFFCRMKSGSPIKVEKEVCQKKKKIDRKSYSVIHCTGYLKSWPPAKIGLDHEDGEAEGDGCNLSCLVAIGKFLPCHARPSDDSTKVEVRPAEFMSRHSLDGKFTYVDQSTTAVLGYLPQEMLGTSMYEYYHQRDVEQLSETHRRVLTTNEKIESAPYRFKAKDGSFIHLKTRSFSFKNPWTTEIEYIVATNTVVPSVEVSSSGQSMDMDGICPEEEYQDHHQDNIAMTNVHKGFNVPGVPGGTEPGAGKIGRQIVEEMQKEIGHLAVDSASGSSAPQRRESPADGHVTLWFQQNASLWASPGEGRYGSESVEGTSNRHLGGGSFISNFLDQESPSESSNNEANDEATMAVIMSLLEADGGLGGPVDFSDLSWPL